MCTELVSKKLADTHMQMCQTELSGRVWVENAYLHGNEWLWSFITLLISRANIKYIPNSNTGHTQAKYTSKQCFYLSTLYAKHQLVHLYSNGIDIDTKRRIFARVKHTEYSRLFLHFFFQWWLSLILIQNLFANESNASDIYLWIICTGFSSESELNRLKRLSEKKNRTGIEIGLIVLQRLRARHTAECIELYTVSNRIKITSSTGRTAFKHSINNNLA